MDEPRNIPIFLTDTSEMSNNQVNVQGQHASLNSVPNECPFCHHKIAPVPLMGILKDQLNVIVIFQCNSHQCKELFQGYYKKSSNSYESTLKLQLLKTTYGTSKEYTFEESILENHPDFTEIYNQSFAAEQLGLKQICGVGYRKSLEFLIKRYAIKKKPEHETEIEKLFLLEVIKTYITDERIKETAIRAAWLGNDETHYKRRWEDKDLSDLKGILDLTISFIQSEYRYAKMIADMPEGRK